MSNECTYRPTLGAIALAVDWVTRSPILALTRRFTLGTMSSWRAWLITSGTKWGTLKNH